MKVAIRASLTVLALIFTVSLVTPEAADARQPPGADIVDLQYSDEFGLLALARYELFRTTDGKTWQAFGLMGRGEAFSAAAAGQSAIIVAADSGRIYRSPDGKNFMAIEPPRDPFGRVVTGIRSLAVSPKGKDVLATNGQGVVRSMDGGVTWKAIEDPFYKKVEARQVILVAFAKNDPVIVTRNGAYHETKAGFEPFSKGLPEKVEPTVASLFEGQILLALPAKGIFLAVKDSAWKPLKGAPGDPVAFVGFTSKGYLAARVASPLNLGDDQGKVWKPVGTSISPNFPPRFSAATPFGDFVVLRGKGLMRLSDENLLPVDLPGDLSTILAYLETSSGHLAGTQGGVYFSSDAGQSWRDVTPADLGAPVNVFLKTPNGRLLLGAEGGGVFASDDGGMSWRAWDKGLGTANTVRGLALFDGGIAAFTENGIMWTADGTDPEWAFRDGGLGRVAIMDFAQDGDTVWLATQIGVFQSRGGGAFARAAGLDGLAFNVDAANGRVAALVDGRILLSEGGQVKPAPPIPERGRSAAVAFAKGKLYAGADKGLFRLEGDTWARAGDASIPVSGLRAQGEGLRVITAGAGTYFMP